MLNVQELFYTMKTVTKNATSNKRKVGNSRKMTTCDFLRKVDLKSYLNYDKKGVKKIFFLRYQYE